MASPALTASAPHPLTPQWEEVRRLLAAELGPAAFASWLKPLTLLDGDGEHLRLAAPTRFMRDWVETHYADHLRRAFGRVNPALTLELVVAQPRATANTAAATAPSTRPAPSAAAPQRSQPAAAPAVAAPHLGADSMQRLEMLCSAPLDPRYTFDQFVVGKPNELAHAAARRVAESVRSPFNPLFLYGGVGLGKTHLMHAIAWGVRENHPDRRAIYMPAEQFMYEFVRAIRFRDTLAFKEMFRTIDMLMIDDVQFIAGKDSTQEEFFHTFNALVDQGKQVVISADRSPSDLEGVEERLRSRLGWGLVVDIHPTDYELRLGILQSKADSLRAEHATLIIEPKVLEFLAHRISSNVRVLEGALLRLHAVASLRGLPVSVDLAQAELTDLLRASDRKVTIEEIQRKVAEYYNLRFADMLSPRRARQVARPRQVAMYLCKRLTTKSLPDIGRKFGGRDHTTVMHAVKKVEELRETDSSFDEELETLRRILET